MEEFTIAVMGDTIFKWQCFFGGFFSFWRPEREKPVAYTLHWIRQW